MKAILVTVLLIGLNIVFAVALGRSAFEPEQFARAEIVPRPEFPKQAIVARSVEARAPRTEFAAIYSANPRQFVTNLRAIGCPEATIKDILVAEISRRYGAQEAALRPTPADHVPWGWSAKTSEGKIIARRQEAAAIAREKTAALREALGYDVPVKLPNYAMTTSDEQFQDLLAPLAKEKRIAAERIQENYWAEVEALRNRTRGFWLTEDVAQLNELKARRKDALEKLTSQ